MAIWLLVYFGEFVEVPFNAVDPNNFRSMIEVTKQFISERKTVIAEASFEFDGNFCSVDILRKVNGGWELIEVKSSSFDDMSNDKVENIYLYDIAYQYYVVSNSGINITKISLMRLNKKYIRSGALDIKNLFVVSDFTAAIKDRQIDIAKQIKNIKAIALQADEPDIAIGTVRKGEKYGCNKPYECGFKKYCWRHIPTPSVYDIGFRLGSVKKDSAYNDGIITYRQVLDSKISLNAKQRRQVETAVLIIPRLRTSLP